MAKKTKAELKEDLKAVKEELSVAKTEKKNFEKSSKLEKGGDHSADPKHGKKWTRLNAMVVKKTEEVEKLQAAITEAKGEAINRPSKYEYPADVLTAGDKKKYRAAQRAAAKKAAKGEAEPKEGKKAKKDKKKETETPETTQAEEGSSKKKSKKDKKEKVED